MEQLLCKMVNEVLNLNVKMADLQVRMTKLEQLQARKPICAFELPSKLDRPLPVNEYFEATKTDK